MKNQTIKTSAYKKHRNSRWPKNELLLDFIERHDAKWLDWHESRSGKSAQAKLPGETGDVFVSANYPSRWVPPQDDPDFVQLIWIPLNSMKRRYLDIKTGETDPKIKAYFSNLSQEVA